jgi:RNA 2',3'-cyclic 3'-phosphodiesterase
MSDQLSLLEPIPALNDGLFLALFPPGQPRAATSAAGQQQLSKHGLRGKLHAVDRLHVSLISFGEHDGVPQRIVDKVREGAASVSFAPFEISFDHVESFGKSGQSGPYPCVLRCDHDSAMRFTTFHQTVCFAMGKVGLGKWIRPLTPHVTLIYADRRVESEAIAPIGWTVTEFVLVHSLLGRSQYIQLGRWSLRG